MSQRNHCDELLAILPVMEAGLREPLEGISQDHLNHRFAPHKMTIGELAVHCAAWPVYFLSAEPPWEKVRWTCRPCPDPLTMAFVDQAIDEGFAAMRETLQRASDEDLDKRSDQERGLGYLICRLQLHFIWHVGQMSYLRHMLDEAWASSGRGHFGRMATAYIGVSYHAGDPQRLRGF